MRAPTISLHVQRLDARLRADVLLIPVAVRQTKTAAPRIPGLPVSLRKAVDTLVKQGALGKQIGQVDNLILPARSPFKRIALVGLGETDPVPAEDLRTAAAAAADWCSRHNLTRAVVSADGLRNVAGTNAARAWAEGAVLGRFRFLEHRSQPPDGKAPTGGRLTFATSGRALGGLRKVVEHARVCCEAVNLARQLGHEPPNVINPVVLARRARGIARKHRLRCHIIDPRQMKQRRMGAILAVGGGSAAPPRIIVLEHKPSRSRGRPIVLVGKAVTHDTGGYSIKPTASMVEMKYDKCGGMAVIGALVAAARLGIRRHVVGVIGAAENMISGSAYRPSDILRAANGKTIEVLDTDAEGRLVLADCLCYAEKEFSPAAVIDLATLTGACMIALGEACAGLFSNDDELAEKLLAGGERTGERLWRLPLWPVYREQIAGTDADLKNVGGRPGGAITAAMFLKEFVGEKTPWAHLDIAGVANISKPQPTCPAGATGFGVRLLVDYLESLR